MENGYRKSLNIRFHLDPRTKLLLLLLFSVIVMISILDEIFAEKGQFNGGYIKSNA